MEIFINNEAFQTPLDSTLKHVLSENGLSDQKGIAVAINNTVVPKTNWGKKTLIPQDKITVIKATQGG